MNDLNEKGFAFVTRLPKSYVCLSDMVGEFIEVKAAYQNTGEVWAAIVGEKLADHCELLDIKNGTLFIETDHPAVAQSLLLNKTKILTAVNKRYPDFKASKIKCPPKKNYAKKVLPSMPAPKAKEETPAPKSEAIVEKTKAEQIIGASITHRELRDRLERMLKDGKQ